MGLPGRLRRFHSCPAAVGCTRTWCHSPEDLVCTPPPDRRLTPRVQERAQRPPHWHRPGLCRASGNASKEPHVWGASAPSGAGGASGLQPLLPAGRGGPAPQRAGRLVLLRQLDATTGLLPSAGVTTRNGSCKSRVAFQRAALCLTPPF